MNILIGLWVLIIGLCVGSFLNVVIIRGIEKEQYVKGRSHCMTCGHELSWKDNIPLFSYLFLRGKCRYCGEKISIQYPIVEAANMILWFLIYLKFGFCLQSAVYMIATSCMIIISVTDFKIQEIPTGPNIIIAILGALMMFVNGTYRDSLLGAAIVSTFLVIVFLITNGNGIGGGDIKLEAALGLLLGFGPVIMSFYLGCVLSIAGFFIMKAIGKATSTKISFGPYLCLGAYICFFYGDLIYGTILSWILGR